MSKSIMCSNAMPTPNKSACVKFDGTPEVMQQLFEQSWKNKDWFPLGTFPEQFQDPGMKDIECKESWL